jgi:hypothetical protein
MKPNLEFDKCNSAMDTILKADPKAVKEAMEAEKEANAKTSQRVHPRGIRRAKAAITKTDFVSRPLRAIH